MQFTSLPSGNRPDAKATKFVLVAALHVAVGAVFIHSMNTKKISLSSLPEQVLVMIEPERPTPPPPPEPPKPAQQLAPPDLFVPKVRALKTIVTHPVDRLRSQVEVRRAPASR